MARHSSERLRRVVDSLELDPQDRVLEIGCGHGVGASLVCERLEGGTYAAIDRSETMIAMATRRNQAHVASGKAVFLVADLELVDLGDRRFDKVFAVRVGLFWKQTTEARAMARLLAPGGTIHVCA